MLQYFGFHAYLNPAPGLEFLGLGEDFYPLWERPLVTNTATLCYAILNRWKGKLVIVDISNFVELAHAYLREHKDMSEISGAGSRHFVDIS